MRLSQSHVSVTFWVGMLYSLQHRARCGTWCSVLFHKFSEKRASKHEEGRNHQNEGVEERARIQG